MARINLTLNEDTYSSIVEHAREEGMPQASMARKLIKEALDRRNALKKLRKLASDYGAEGKGSARLLEDLEAGQLDLIDDEAL